MTHLRQIDMLCTVPVTDSLQSSDTHGTGGLKIKEPAMENGTMETTATWTSTCWNTMQSKQTSCRLSQQKARTAARAPCQACMCQMWKLQMMIAVCMSRRPDKSDAAQLLLGRQDFCNCIASSSRIGWPAYLCCSIMMIVAHDT